MNIETINDLYEAIVTGHYKVEYERKTKMKDNHVIDENLSVKENRDMVESINNKIDKEIQDYRDRKAEMSKRQEEDVIKVFAYEKNLSEARVELLYEYAYREFHADGMFAVVQALEELTELTNDILSVD